MKGSQAYRVGQKVVVDCDRPIVVGGVPTYYRTATVTGHNGRMVIVKFSSGQTKEVGPEKLCADHAGSPHSRRSTGATVTIHSGWLNVK